MENMPKINRNEKHEETMKERYYRIVNSSEPVHGRIKRFLIKNLMLILA